MDIKGLDSEFIKSLWSTLYRKSSSLYTVRRAFGKSLNENDVSVFMSFLDVSNGYYIDKYKDIYFLVASMFYIVERPSDTENNNKKYIKFEKLLGRIYGKSKSTDKTISAFIDSCFDANGIFVNRFVRLVSRCKKELVGNEHIDFSSLLYDLKHWNDEDKNVKYTWAKSIVLNKSKTEE